MKRKISPAIDSRAQPWLIGVMASSDKPSERSEEREARLADALRANLRRRKQTAPPKAPIPKENSSTGDSHCAPRRSG